MKKNIIILLIFNFILINVFSDVTDDKIKILDRYMEILEYGIEEEVVDLLNQIGNNPKKEIFDLIISRYKEALMNKTKIDMIMYFSECSNIPENLLNLLYEETKSEPNDLKLHIQLLSFLGKKGQKREGLLLLERLDSENKQISSAAADALSVMSNKELIISVIDRLKLSDTSDDKFLQDDIRGKLILSLGEMKAKEASEYLRNIINESTSEKYIIMYSMVSLGKIQDLESVNVIEKKLNSEDVKIQEYAAYALSLFKDQKLIPIIKIMFKHNNEKVRFYACQAVVLNKANEFIRILIYKYKNDPSIVVKKEALISLLSFENTGVMELKKINNDKKFVESELFIISEAISKNPNNDNVGFLSDLYDNTDDKGRESITKGLIYTKSNILDPVLKKILNDKNDLLRLGALKIIFNIKDSSLWNDIKIIALNDPNQSVRLTAKKYLELK